MKNRFHLYTTIGDQEIYLILDQCNNFVAQFYAKDYAISCLEILNHEGK